MNKVCIAVPTYPNHYNRTKSLLYSFYNHKLNKYADLFLIFTNENEKELFGQNSNAIIIPKNLRILESGGIINIKKFFAIKTLYHDYEYIIIFDSETLFIREINLYKVCESFYTNKILLGNSTEKNCSHITFSAKRWFPKHEKLDKVTLYLWFNNPCIYKSSLCEHFFHTTGILDNLKTIKRYDFDYYIFMYYLIQYHDWKVIDLNTVAMYGMCEHNKFIAKSQKFKKYTFYMCNPCLLRKLPMKHIFALIQMDHVPANFDLTSVLNFKQKICLKFYKLISF